MTNNEIHSGIKIIIVEREGKKKEPSIIRDEFFMHSFRKGKKDKLLSKVSTNTCFPMCLDEEHVSSSQTKRDTPANHLPTSGRRGKYSECQSGLEGDNENTDFIGSLPIQNEHEKRSQWGVY